MEDIKTNLLDVVIAFNSYPVEMPYSLDSIRLLKDIKADVEKNYFIKTLCLCGGNMVLASKKSGVGRPYLYRKFKKYNIDIEKVRYLSYAAVVFDKREGEKDIGEQIDLFETILKSVDRFIEILNCRKQEENNENKDGLSLFSHYLDVDPDELDVIFPESNNNVVIDRKIALIKNKKAQESLEEAKNRIEKEIVEKKRRNEIREELIRRRILNG